MEISKEQKQITSNSLTSTPATVLQRRIALVMSGLLALVVLLTLPYARQMFPHMPAFIAFYCALAFFADLITAYLLFGQFFRTRSPSLLVLATTYLYSSLIVLPYVLSFPGLFSETGLLHAGTQTTNWLWIFWHTGFPLGILFYVLLDKKYGARQATSIGFSQMLLEDAAPGGWNQLQLNNLERILKNGQHLLSLINDVLGLSKIEAGQMAIPYSQVDVRELLTSVVEETQSIAFAQHLVLRAEVEEGIVSLESNPLKLRQVLLNLLSNALKFTQQGEVTVSARRVISPDQQAEQIAIAVKDSGIGIPADIQERIFEAFYQADGSYTRKFGGTGLGLSIVSQLTKLLGGTIEVTSSQQA